MHTQEVKGFFEDFKVEDIDYLYCQLCGRFSLSEKHHTLFYIFECKHTVCNNCTRVSHREATCVVCNRKSYNTLLSSKDHEALNYIFGNIEDRLKDIAQLSQFQTQYKNELIRLLKKKVYQQREIQRKVKSSIKDYKIIKEQLNDSNNENIEIKHELKRLKDSLQYGSINNHSQREFAYLTEPNPSKELITYNTFQRPSSKNNVNGNHGYPEIDTFNQKGKRISLRPPNLASSPFSRPTGIYNMPKNVLNEFELDSVHDKYGGNKRRTLTKEDYKNINYGSYTFQNGLTLDTHLSTGVRQELKRKHIENNIRSNGYGKVEDWLENENDTLKADTQKQTVISILSARTPIVRQTPCFLR